MSRKSTSFESQSNVFSFHFSDAAVPAAPVVVDLDKIPGLDDDFLDPIPVAPKPAAAAAAGRPAAGAKAGAAAGQAEGLLGGLTGGLTSGLGAASGALGGKLGDAGGAAAGAASGVLNAGKGLFKMFGK